jgi:ribonuclease P protein component
VFAARKVIRSTCFDLLRSPLRNVEATQAVGADGIEEQHSVSASLAISRLGLVIPKRLARRAVLRNTIKRQAREAFRHHCETLPTVDIVLRLARWPKEIAILVATPAVLKHILRQEIDLLLEKLRHQTASLAAS